MNRSFETTIQHSIKLIVIPACLFLSYALAETSPAEEPLGFGNRSTPLEAEQRKFKMNTTENQGHLAVEVDRISTSLAYSLVDDDDTGICNASSFSMDDPVMTIVDTDCMQDIVTGGDSSLVFESAGMTSLTCTLDSLVMEENDSITVTTSGNCFDSDFDNDGFLNSDDLDPLVPEPNQCSLANEVLPSHTFAIDDRYSCRASGSISTNDSIVVVGDGAVVLYMAPSVRLKNGFSVADGGIFHAVGRDAVDIAL